MIEEECEKDWTNDIIIQGLKRKEYEATRDWEVHRRIQKEMRRGRRREMT